MTSHEQDSTIFCTEIVHKKQVDIILKNLNHPDLRDVMKITEKSDKVSQKTILKKFKESCVEWSQDPNFYAIDSQFAQKYKGRGRFQCKYNLVEKLHSLQGINKRFRATFANGIYDDIDIINAHPVLLHQFITKTSILTPNKSLEKYVNERDFILNTIMTENNFNRNEAKELLLTIMNGGAKRVKVNGFCDAFRNDMDITLHEFYNLAKPQDKDNIYRKYFSKKQVNAVGSTLNNLLQDLENNCLQAIIKKIKEFGLSVDVLIFDGCMVRRPYDNGFATNISISNEQLQMIEEFVSETTSYNIKLSIKSFDDNIIDTSRFKFEFHENKLDDDYVKDFHECFGKENVRICDEKIYYFNNDTKLWTLIKPDHLGNLMKSVLTDHYSETVNDIETLDTLKTYLGKHSSTAKLSSGYTGKLEFLTHPDFLKTLNSLEWLIPFGTKVVDIRNLHVRDLTQTDYFTFSHTKDFIPSAMKSPETEEFLSTYFYNNEEKKLDQELFESFKLILGYLMSGNNSCKCLFFILGITNTGKSALVKFILKIMGEFGMTVTDKIILKSGKEIDTDIQQIETNPRVGVASEFDETQILNGKQVKALTGNDEISYRPMRDTIRKFVCKTKFIFGSNEIPQFDVNDTGLDTRLIFIPLKNVFEIRDGVLEEFLEKYMNDAFSWCVYQANRFYLNNKKFPISESMKATKKIVYDEKNPMVSLRDDYEKVSDESEFTPGTDIMNHYYSWKIVKDIKTNYSQKQLEMMLSKSFGPVKKCDFIDSKGRRIKSIYPYKINAC
jgi:P4 family phage/plasmid primase-like protien